MGNMMGCKNKELEDTEKIIIWIRKKNEKEIVEEYKKIVGNVKGF
jgi:hypothetical protein